MFSMSGLYQCLNRLTRETYWMGIAIALVIAGFCLSMLGHYLAFPKMSWSSMAYESVKIFILDSATVDDLEHVMDETGATKSHMNWSLQAARWTGFVVWFFTIIAVLYKLFHQHLREWLVWLLAREHVIFVGLGMPEEGRERLPIRYRSEVDPLTKKAPDVLIIEPDDEHPAINHCRDVGIVCLKGSAQTKQDLQRGQLSRAKALVVVGEDDQKNIDLLMNAAELLQGTSSSTPTQNSATKAGTTKKENQPQKKSPYENPLAENKPGHVSCILQVSEPGLLEVLRKHPVYTDPNDKMHLRFYNMHEMSARAMLREAIIDLEMPMLKKVLLVGIGIKGRLGEALVTRMIKDRMLDHPEADSIRIDIIDKDAKSWSDCLTQRIHYLHDYQEIRPLEIPASYCGFVPYHHTDGTQVWNGVVQEKYDAIFVCIGEEAIATQQAVRIAEALTHAAQHGHPECAKTPVVVRVKEEQAGFGKLFASKDEEVPQWPNIRAVGTQDRVFDIVKSLHPTQEMVAQVLHQDYLALHKKRILNETDAAKLIVLKAKPAFKAWTKMAEKFRQANRDLASRLSNYLEIRDEKGNIKRTYQLEFAPNEVINPQATYRYDDQELEIMAKLEHDKWFETQEKRGWRLPPKKADGTYDDKAIAPQGIEYNSNMVSYAELDDGTKEYDRNIIRRLPHILAKADYKLVEV